MATVTHAELGEKTFGVAPGAGEVWITLRSLTNDGMARLVEEAENLARATGEAHDLSVDWSYHDVFAGCVNDAGLTDLATSALKQVGLQVTGGDLPMRWSEDFGLYGAICPSVMLFPGSGTTTPALHNPDYDFPDDLIRICTEAFMAILSQLEKETRARRGKRGLTPPF